MLILKATGYGLSCGIVPGSNPPVYLIWGLYSLVAYTVIYGLLTRIFFSCHCRPHGCSTPPPPPAVVFDGPITQTSSTPAASPLSKCWFLFLFFYCQHPIQEVVPGDLRQLQNGREARGGRGGGGASRAWYLAHQAQSLPIMSILQVCMRL